MNLLKLIFILSIFISNTAISQIIIVEAKNLTDTTRGTAGTVHLNFNINTNTVTTLSGGGGSEIHHLWRKNRLISLNQYNVILNVDEARNAAVNQGYQHLRYTYDFNYYFTGAVFSQIQTNPVLRIKTRLLNGGGPRFNLQPYGTNSLLLGTMLMHEYEEELDTAVVHNDLRLSLYLFYKIKIAENVRINSVTYYQPRVDYFDDFRVSTTLNLDFAISSKFGWNVNFNLLYDAFPVFDPAIPNLTYAIKNSLTYRF